MEVIHMGRTIPSFRMLLEGIIGELSDFRRALRGDDRAAFDSLMNKARIHASSCTVVPTLDPMEAIFLSILVEQEKEICSLREVLSKDGRAVISDGSKEQLTGGLRSDLTRSRLKMNVPFLIVHSKCIEPFNQLSAGCYGAD
jgi:hypothetical protein